MINPRGSTGANTALPPAVPGFARCQVRPQLGDLSRAKTLLRRAARAFGPREAVAGARCVVAEAEIALVSRDLNWPVNALDTAHDALERHGDRANAAHARYLKTRYLLLIGRLDEAERRNIGARRRRVSGVEVGAFFCTLDR